MVDALRKEPVDCVLLWSVWPETYSYTHYESFASNIFVITNRQSGKIAKQVEERGNGIVLNDEKELFRQLPTSERQRIFNEAQKLSRKLNLRVKREFFKEKEHNQDKQLNRPTTKSRER